MNRKPIKTSLKNDFEILRLLENCREARFIYNQLMKSKSYNFYPDDLNNNLEFQMISFIYTVYDSMAEFYSAPFMCKSKGEALRSFIEALGDEKSTVGKYPDCFTLFELGHYDDSDATYKLHTVPVVVGKGTELRSHVPSSPLSEHK